MEWVIAGIVIVVGVCVFIWAVFHGGTRGYDD